MFSKDSRLSIHFKAHVKAPGNSLTGVTAPQSFVERKRIERNRQSIRQYRFSQLGSTTQRHNISVGNSRSAPQPSASSRHNVKRDARPAQSFSEPGGRSYNPYS